MGVIILARHLLVTCISLNRGKNQLRERHKQVLPVPHAASERLQPLDAVGVAAAFFIGPSLSQSRSRSVGCSVFRRLSFILLHSLPPSPAAAPCLKRLSAVTSPRSRRPVARSVGDSISARSTAAKGRRAGTAGGVLKGVGDDHAERVQGLRSVLRLLRRCLQLFPHVGESRR